MSAARCRGVVSFGIRCRVEVGNVDGDGDGAGDGVGAAGIGDMMVESVGLESCSGMMWMGRRGLGSAVAEVRFSSARSMSCFAYGGRLLEE